MSPPKGTSSRKSLYPEPKRGAGVIEKKPWHQQPRETDLQYEHFCGYLKWPKVMAGRGDDVHMKRNLADYARSIGAFSSQLNKWLKDNDWYSRAEAYDEMMRRPDGIEETIQRQAYGTKLRDASSTIFDILNLQLLKVKERVAETPLEVKEIIELGKLGKLLGDKADTIDQPVIDRGMEVLDNEINRAIGDLGALIGRLNAGRLAGLGQGSEGTSAEDLDGEDGGSGISSGAEDNFDGLPVLPEQAARIRDSGDGPEVDEGSAEDCERSEDIEEDSS
jgi:hypothetical protein